MLQADPAMAVGLEGTNMKTEHTRKRGWRGQMGLLAFARVVVLVIAVGTAGTGLTASGAFAAKAKKQDVLLDDPLTKASLAVQAGDDGTLSRTFVHGGLRLQNKSTTQSNALFPMFTA